MIDRWDYEPLTPDTGRVIVHDMAIGLHAIVHGQVLRALWNQVASAAGDQAVDLDCLASFAVHYGNEDIDPLSSDDIASLWDRSFQTRRSSEACRLCLPHPGDLHGLHRGVSAPSSQGAKLYGNDPASSCVWAEAVEQLAQDHLPPAHA